MTGQQNFIEKYAFKNSNYYTFTFQNHFTQLDCLKKLKNFITHTHLSASHPSLMGAVNSLGNENFLFLIRRPRI
jgi:hypothetical protein